MKRVLAVLFGLVALMVMAAGSGHAAGEPALLFVLTGQSNAGQQGKPGQVSSADAAPVAGAFYRAPQHTKVQTVVAMQPWRGAFGVELSFARAVRAACPGREVVVAKVYSGGTSIIAWDPDAPNSQWQYDLGKVGNAGTSPQYPRVLDAAAHDAADAVTWVQHDIWIEYGDATLAAIVPDNDYKPMFVLTSSNTSWDYDEFYDLVSGASRMQSRRTGRWTPSGTGSNMYGGNQNTTDDPYEELGLASSVAGTKAGISYYWSLFNPCGITAANFQNGQFWHGRADWWAGYVQSSSGGSAWTTNYSIPTSSNETWNSWSQNVTGLTVNYVRLWLSGYASLAKPMRLECADVTVTLNSSYTPLVVLAAADQTYRVQPTIANQTTGESITIDAAVDVDQSIEIDVANHQVTLLADDSDAYNAVETVEGVRRWILRLQAGSNTLSYTQSGLVEVDVDIEFERRYRV